MLTEFSSGEGSQHQTAKGMFRAVRWNQYLANWPIVLNALRRLWELGKVSELKSPFYEPIKKPEEHKPL